FLNLESKDDLTTLDASIGDQATVLTGDANDPVHRYELMGDVTEIDTNDYADLGQPTGWPNKITVRVNHITYDDAEFPEWLGSTGELELAWSNGQWLWDGGLYEGDPISISIELQGGAEDDVLLMINNGPSGSGLSTLLSGVS